MRHTQLLRPVSADIGGYIYLVEFTNGTIKVGSTKRPMSRFRKHESDASAFGIGVLNEWLSDDHVEYLDSEQRLITTANSLNGKRSRKEYFLGLDLLTLIHAAERIVASAGHSPAPDDFPKPTGPLYSVADVSRMTQMFSAPYILRGCRTGDFAYTLVRGEYRFTGQQIRDLLAQHATGGGASKPIRSLMPPQPPRTSRSLLHRNSRRAA